LLELYTNIYSEIKLTLKDITVKTWNIVPHPKIFY